MKTTSPSISALNTGTRLSDAFFARDPLIVARELLGAVVVRQEPDGTKRAGVIVETEAYRGEEDQACHARVGRTKRTATMYGPPGRAYVYLIYGMYNMLNVVCWPEGEPAAVLIRAIEPLCGTIGKTDGPGKLCRALNIDRTLNGVSLDGTALYFLARQTSDAANVVTGSRVGIDYAGEWALRPWRFAIKGHPSVSRPRL